MKKSTMRFLTVIITALALSTGCAKKDLVKQDETIAPASTAQQAAAQTTPAQGSAAETVADEKAVEEASLRQEGIGGKASTASSLSLGVETVYFDFDSYLLSPGTREMLQKNAKALSARSGSEIRLEGHTDERGSEDYNLALGERRARSVMEYLIRLGVAEERLSVRSYGEEKPADEGHYDEAWSKNRRVEFVLVEK